ncbi:MAG TPA: glycine zipper family protein [Pricia antarctica]|uniref:Glycine zipper family protein n=1 Tax=Pricia antarctica TaxID=641691 RepID=A0A831QTS9_9FLAO|nr:glycine zipper family protein [Pricia antarctica]
MKRLMILVSLLIIGGCATYRPIIDMKNVDRAQYSLDLRDCQNYARQVNVAGNAAVSAGMGAAVGALFGAITGAWLGDAGRGAGIGASLGGAGGLVQGVAGSAETQVSIVRKCMSGRGYNVLH